MPLVALLSLWTVHRLLASVSAHSALQMHLCTALFISVVVPAMAVMSEAPSHGIPSLPCFTVSWLMSGGNVCVTS